MIEQLIQTIVDWANNVHPAGVYLIFFGIAYMENIIPPVPGDVLVAFGGYLAAEGTISFSILLFATVIASAAGFMTMYRLGYSWGVGIKNNGNSHFILRFVNARHFARGKRWMDSRGQWVIAANRFLAGTRTVVALMAGISHLDWRYTVMNSLISSLLWNFILIYLGWSIKDNWQIVGSYLSTYGEIVTIGIVIAVFLRISYKYWVRKKNKNQPAEKE